MSNLPSNCEECFQLFSPRPYYSYVSETWRETDTCESCLRQQIEHTEYYYITRTIVRIIFWLTVAIGSSWLFAEITVGIAESLYNLIFNR